MMGTFQARMHGVVGKYVRLYVVEVSGVCVHAIIGTFSCD
jgi:hypothetical protein